MLLVSTVMLACNYNIKQPQMKGHIYSVYLSITDNNSYNRMSLQNMFICWFLLLKPKNYGQCQQLTVLIKCLVDRYRQTDRQTVQRVNSYQQYGPDGCVDWAAALGSGPSPPCPVGNKYLVDTFQQQNSMLIFIWKEHLNWTPKGKQNIPI